jgi:short-subunit dehydrogenase
MSTFKNRTVLITGGASGIGFLMGKYALEHGASHLIIWDINQQKLEDIPKKLHQFKEKISTYQVDIGSPEQIYQTADTFLDRFSHCDILINNAGIVVGKPFSEHSAADISDTIHINLLGMMHTTRSFLPAMIEYNRGHIVNIASAAGLMPNPKMTVYAGSKWGVIGWSESLRTELNQQNSSVKVTTVEPSYINTGMFKGVKPPVLTPLLDANDISERIIQAIENDRIHLRAPFMVKFLPFLNGILPTKLFDFIAGKLFQVYQSMDTFEGRKNTEQS